MFAVVTTVRNHPQRALCYPLWQGQPHVLYNRREPCTHSLPQILGRLCQREDEGIEVSERRGEGRPAHAELLLGRLHEVHVVQQVHGDVQRARDQASSEAIRGVCEGGWLFSFRNRACGWAGAMHFVSTCGR